MTAPESNVDTALRDATTALAGFLIAEVSLGETLRRIAELALAATDADGVGLTLLEGRKRPVTVFASNVDLSGEADQIQYLDDTGPCLEAYRERRVVRVGDAARVAAQWPGYARVAAAVGVRSSLSVPLMAADETYGALNLYARTRGAFSGGDVSKAQVFATHASVVLANASAYWDARDLATGLAEAMQSRAVIEQAKGKLMASGRYTAEEAFEVLARASQRTNVRLRDIAHRIVHATDPPPPRPPSEDGMNPTS